MTTTCPRSDLLTAFAAALDADLEISPMIIVGGTDDSYPWLNSLSDLSEACEAGRTICYAADIPDNVDDLRDWVSSREDGDESLHTIAILTQGMGETSLLSDMLHAVRDDAWGEHMVVVVIDPDQLDATRRDIRTILGVHQALVPVCWQGVEPRACEVRIVANPVRFHGHQGRLVRLGVALGSPYAHNVVLNVEGATKEADSPYDALAAMFPRTHQERFDMPPDSDFAALATVRDGNLYVRIDDLEQIQAAD